MSTEESPTYSERALALLETLVALFTLGDPAPGHLAGVLRRVAPEEIAAVLSDFPAREKILVYQAIPSTEDRGTVLKETDPQSRREILEEISEAERATVLGEMSVDDLVDQLETLPEEEKEKVIATLEKEEASEVKELLTFAPDTAGGMMITDFLSIPAGVTSRQALAEIQGNLNVEVISYVYVTDPAGVLKGVVSIRDILKAKPDTSIEDYITRDPIAVSLETDREEVAAVVDKYKLAVVPVLDSESRMKGIVTFDDIFDAVQEEHSEDMLRMAGTVAIHPYFEPIHLGVVKRLPFLLVTMLGGFGVLAVKGIFEGDIPLRLFTASLGVIPLLSGLSGNVAIVASTIMVRGLATGDINLGRAWKAVGREMAVGTLTGIVLSATVTIVFTAIDGFDQGATIGWVVGVGLVVSVGWAAFLGAMIPVLCKASGIVDPAIASGPFVTMVCDLSASLIFLFLVFALLT